MGYVGFGRNIISIWQPILGKRFKSTVSSLKTKYDAIVVGAGDHEIK